MANNSRGIENDNSGADGPVPAGRVYDLTWALFDELIADDEIAELEGLLLNDTVARDSYLRCAQLHADLATHFATEAKSERRAVSKTPILGFLNESLPQFGAPSAEDAAQ